MRRPGSLGAVVVLVAAALLAALGTAPTASADDPPVPVPVAEPVPPVAEPVPPATPVTPVTRRTLPLRFDDRGPLVATAQERLLWLGYPLSRNSQDKDLFGITMRRAVTAFQAKHGLPVRGRIDERTWRNLRRLAEPVGVLPRQCTEVPNAICIDKATRLLRFVVKGTVEMTADARFGEPGMETGEGVFRVTSKSYKHVSSLYGSWMPRALFFNGDEAVHYSPDFASVGYSRGSHGCVGLRDMDKATWLFDQVPVGTRVYVYWS